MLWLVARLLLSREPTRCGLVLDNTMQRPWVVADVVLEIMSSFAYSTISRMGTLQK